MADIAIAGETYSPNLGDGVIAESLAFLFQQNVPAISTSLLDISGRTTWSTTPDQVASNHGLRPLRSLLSSFSPLATIVRFLRWQVVLRRRLSRRWLSALSESKTLVIGGGQLLMDNALNFPLRVSELANLAASSGIAYHFSACGVGAEWSPIALSLLKKALLGASTVTVRDTVSSQRLQSFVPGMPSPPVTTFDPAIWAAEVYGTGNNRKSDGTVGLGILGLHEVNIHAPRGSEFTQHSLLEFWAKTASLLYQRGYAPELFTNGTVSDYNLAVSVRREVKSRQSIDVALQERPMCARDLAQGISRYRAVVSPRLHGNIVALSYGIPASGISWDGKVRAFFKDIGAESLCVSMYDRDPDAVVNALGLAIQEGIDQHTLRAWKERAMENVMIVLKNS